MAKEYAVYKGDELLCIGTSKECAEILKVKRDYIRWLTSPSAKKILATRKNPDKCMVGFKL